LNTEKLSIKEKKMKYWIKNNRIFGISLKNPFIKNDSNEGRVISITVQESGFVDFYEGCDHFFNIELTKEEAIEALEEAISYIKKESKKK
jgi:hypothetical protein